MARVILTDREIEVLELSAGGFNTKGIAQILELSPHTVKTHIVNLRGILGSKTITQAVAKGIRQKVIK